MVEEAECSEGDSGLIRSVTTRDIATATAVTLTQTSLYSAGTASTDKSTRSSSVGVGVYETDSADSSEHRSSADSSGTESAVNTGSRSTEEEEEEEEEGSWDMDNMCMGDTDTYVLYTVCDSRSSMEVKPRRGLFDDFLPSEIEQQDEE